MGIQSFGGGQAIQLYAYRYFVQRHRIFTPAEWSEAWGLCQIAPGMNLIALDALVGARLAGPAGVVASLAGMLLPSVAITVLVTALYSRLAAVPAINAGMHGIIAASVGLALVNAIRIGRPALIASWRFGGWARIVVTALPPVAATLILVTNVPIYGLLVAGGLLVAASTWRASSRAASEQV